MKNFVIEGDNLETMKRLLVNYENGIDVIVADPPYNTNIDYIDYDDRIADWSGYMKPRLETAYGFLSSRGVMFIHIDEGEFATLYDICADIFGAKNLMSLIWKKTNELFDRNRKEKPLESGVRRTHEFILTCFRDKARTELSMIKQPVFREGKWIQESRCLESILDNLGTTSSAKDELGELLGDRNVFSTPKPLKLVKELIRASSARDSTVMDIFAGSGTTAHAVMDLNKEDGGNRSFIIITNNENDIFNKVTCPRLTEAIRKNGYNCDFDKISLSSDSGFPS